MKGIPDTSNDISNNNPNDISNDGANHGANEASRRFPATAGILLGAGVGGFFDGIVLHQLLQWHHVLSNAGLPATTLGNLRLDVLWDGLFHVVAYLFVLAGLALLWRAARRPHGVWSASMLLSTMLMGFGLFNLVEGVIDHHLLRLHHVNETVPPGQWWYWDLGFLAWGALMLAGGWLLWRRPRTRLRLMRPARQRGLS